MNWFMLAIALLVRRLWTLIGCAGDVDQSGSALCRCRFVIMAEWKLGWITSNRMFAEARIRPLPHIETPMSNGPPHKLRPWTLEAPEHCCEASRPDRDTGVMV